jgi:thiamine biosynthesis protein ThiS
VIDATAEPALVELTVNGEPRALAAGTSVADLLASLGQHPRLVAVERNGVTVPRATYPATILRPGDHLEIVAFTQGG